MFARFFIHGAIVAALTIVTQIGGLAWAAALLFRRRFVAFIALYLAVSLSAIFIAPLFGREYVSCWRDGPLQVGSWLYCGLNRTYATPTALDALERAAAAVEQRHPGAVTILLDANFPFIGGFPLLPHLSHDDGRKADLAFYYKGENGYEPGLMRSPIGYFAFEQGPTDCPEAWPSMRWNLSALQPLWPDHAIDEARTRDLLRALVEDPSVEKIFIEPHLKSQFGVEDARVRFQGCRAARHDDHIHMQVK